MVGNYESTSSSSDQGPVNHVKHIKTFHSIQINGEVLSGQPFDLGSNPATCFQSFFNPRRRAVFELWNVTYHTNVLYHREWSIMTNDLIYKFQQGKIILLCDFANSAFCCYNFGAFFIVLEKQKGNSASTKKRRNKCTAGSKTK